jgi:8-oxo-dGTP pyrophosphatase MutT (NUDIX family)
MSVPAAETRTWVHEIRDRLEKPGATRLPTGKAGRPAAVLVPLFVDAGEIWLVLTKRAEALNNHAGQIAFPGGGLDADETSWDAALRETHEEIGVDPTRILRLGQLDELYAEVSDYRIVPCVGVVPFPLEPVINEEEIDEVFSIPLLAFADVKVIEDRVVEWRGKEHQIRVYHVGGRAVWGLTARIIQNLLARLGIAPMVEEAPPAPPAG